METKIYRQLFLFFTLAIPSFALAATGDLNKYLSDIYIWSIGIGGALAVYTIINAGIEYAISQGDVEKINTAKEKIAGAFLGLLLLVLTYLIVATLHTGSPGTSSVTTTGTITGAPATSATISTGTAPSGTGVAPPPSETAGSIILEGGTIDDLLNIDLNR